MGCSNSSKTASPTKAGGKLILGYHKGFRGRAGPTRAILAYAKVDWEDCFYDDKNKWADAKGKLPMAFPNLPYINDGKCQITESEACVRYAAGKYCPELLGKTIEEKCKINIISSKIDDCFDAMFGFASGKEDLAKMPSMIEAHFKPICSHMGTSKFLAGDKVTYVDFKMLDVAGLVNSGTNGQLLKECPAMGPYMERICALPNFCDYLKSDRYKAY